MNNALNMLNEHLKYLTERKQELSAKLDELINNKAKVKEYYRLRGWFEMVVLEILDIKALIRKLENG